MVVLVESPHNSRHVLCPTSKKLIEGDSVNYLVPSNAVGAQTTCDKN